MFRRFRGGTQTTYEADDTRYVVRKFREGDREALLSLFQDVLDDGMSTEWFEWKYVDNPHVDDVPVYVATVDGELVGGAGFWVLQLHTGERSIPTVQPCDAAVHPDHRRRGLYTQILGAGLEHFSEDGVEVLFDFPNELSKQTFEKYGWRLVERRETYYRVQRPSELLEGTVDGDGNRDRDRSRNWRGLATEVLRRGGDLVARGYLEARVRLDRTERRDLEVRRYETVPARTLAALARRDVPDRFHVVRDPEFYRWRFENPQWTYTTYVGYHDDEPIAAIVTGTRASERGTVTQLAEVLPLGGHRDWRSTADSMLRAVLTDTREAALVVAPSGVIPPHVFGRYGFHGDRSMPLSLAATPTVHGVCSLTASDDDEWIVDGKRLTDADSWQISFCEYDTN